MTDMTITVVPPSASANGMTIDKLLNVADELGAQAGKGKDTQVKFGLAIVEAAFQGHVDLVVDKHGQGKDDATLLSERYFKAQGSNTQFDTKAGNIRKLVSCHRTCIKLGLWDGAGPGEPLGNVGRLMALRQNIRKVPSEAKRIDDAFNTLMRYARAQLRSPDELIADDASLKEFVYRREASVRTAKQVIEGVVHTLTNLTKGKGGVVDNSKPIRDAIKTLRERITEIGEESNAQKRKAKTQAAA